MKTAKEKKPKHKNCTCKKSTTYNSVTKIRVCNKCGKQVIYQTDNY